SSGPSARNTSDTSNKVVGQTSGQWVNPKNTRKGSPFMSWSVIGLEFWSTSLNGPPTADGIAIGDGPRPVTMKMTAENNTRPATKAPSASSKRPVRAVISEFRSTKTGGEAGADRLKDH